MPRTRHTSAFALITAASLALTACGSGDPAAAPGKWGISASAIKASQISPPEIK
ncbi:hypothetical protein [Streptomyces sp. NPDC102437]|uniref:hypothetical protein n=1 Tax=Streptomyces sp. NPDC102437 TaxID=3366175 RepID=UPI00380F3727